MSHTKPSTKATATVLPMLTTAKYVTALGAGRVGDGGEGGGSGDVGPGVGAREGQPWVDVNSSRHPMNDLLLMMPGLVGAQPLGAIQL